MTYMWAMSPQLMFYGKTRYCDRAIAYGMSFVVGGVAF